MEQEQKKQTVFLIDDDAFLLDMYSLKFKASGFIVDVASGVEEALVKIKEGFSPDVVLLDIVMPNQDGFGFLEKIKKEKLLSNSLIIILSNLGQKDDIEKGKKLGADDYVVKASFTPSEIVAKVKDILSKSEARNPKS